MCFLYAALLLLLLLISLRDLLSQIEYANKAVENAGTVIGLKCKDGIVLGVEKLVASKLLVPGSNRRIFNVDHHIGLVSVAQASKDLPWVPAQCLCVTSAW